MVRKARKKDTTEPKKEEIIVTDLHELAEQFNCTELAEQFNKRLDKTIEILDKLLKLKKHQMGIYE